MRSSVPLPFFYAKMIEILMCLAGFVRSCQIFFIFLFFSERNTRDALVSREKRGPIPAEGEPIGRFF